MAESLPTWAYGRWRPQPEERIVAGPPGLQLFMGRLWLKLPTVDIVTYRFTRASDRTFYFEATNISRSSDHDGGLTWRLVGRISPYKGGPRIRTIVYSATAGEGTESSSDNPLVWPSPVNRRGGLNATSGDSSN